MDGAAPPAKVTAVLAPSLALALFSAEPLVLSGSEPRPLALLLVTPTGEPGRISRSEAIRTVGEALESRTELFPEIVDPSVNEDCKGRLACIVRELRAASRSRHDPARWLLVVTQITLEGEPDRASATLVDLRRAEGLVDSVFGTDAEVRLDEASARAGPVLLESSDELASYLTRALDGPFRAPLAERGDLRAKGRLRIEPSVPGAIVQLDGRALGAVGSGPTVINRVRLGVHELRITAAGAPPWETWLELSAHAPEASIRPELDASPGRRSFLRPGLAVGGGVLAAAGAALVTWAILQAGDVDTACFRSRPGCEEGTGFAGFGYDARASRPEAVDPEGIGVAPLGAALAIAGTGIALGALLEGGEGVPWWSLGLSVVAGGAVLSASLLLDEGRLP